MEIETGAKITIKETASGNDREKMAFLLAMKIFMSWSRQITRNQSLKLIQKSRSYSFTLMKD